MRMKDVTQIIIHCSATPKSMNIGVAEIREWHLDRGWNDVGYHFIIRRDGTLEEGRDLSTPGAHARGHNSHSWGICLVGGIDAEGNAEFNYTNEQMKTLGETLDLLNQLSPEAEVVGHRDLPNVHKACPCFDVRAWLENKEG